jgi:single-strand DNA-binding protein
MNKVFILGRLGTDPELKNLPNGASCSFSVATSEKWKDADGQKQERTEWHKVVVYGKLAELCAKYIHKGSQALVEGRVQTRSWDAKDGSKKYTTEIIANDVRFLDAKPKAEPELPF